MNRLLGAWRRHGTGGFFVHAAKIGCRAVYLREEHVWNLLDIDQPHPRPSARIPRLQLVRVAEDQGELIEKAGLNAVRAERWRSRVAQLWLVLSAGEPIFSSWLFYDAIPVFAAREGWMTLPAGTACIEDAVTHPDMRGCGVAASAWAAIADAAAADGVKLIITKTEIANVSSLRAHQKVGFRELARVRLIRVGPLRRVRVETTSETPLAHHLVEQLLHPPAIVRHGVPRARGPEFAVELPSVVSARLNR